MMKIWLLVLLLVHCAHSFSNLMITELLGLGYSHGGITGKAIQQISYEYLNVTTDAEFIEKLKFDLWTKHVDTVEIIEKYNDNVDDDPETKNRPMYHFDAERFVRGNNLLLTSQELILTSIRNGQYSIAREQLGKYLHTHQDFYSHSNWIEMNETRAYKLLGEINAFNGNVATINMSTCSNCRKPCDICYYECVDNINPLINQEKIFTSGYYVGEVEDGQPVDKPTNVLKCSHGSIIDTTGDIPALGGINKDVKTSIISPHYYFQEKAANAAIESTYLFLKKLWHLTETKQDNTSHFGRLLELVPDHQSLIFIIDLSNSMKDDIVKIKILLREIIINITSNKISMPSEIIIVAFEKQPFSIVTKPYIKGDIDRLLKFLDSLTIMDDTKFMMNAIITGLSLTNDHCFAYVFTNDFNNDNERSSEVSILARRKNCQINFVLSTNAPNHQQMERREDQTIEQLTFETRGIRVNIPNDNLFSIKQLITQTLNTKSTPILLINPVLPNSDLYNFHIDSSVEMIQFAINIKSEYQSLSNSDIKNFFIPPDHSSFDFLLNFDSQYIKIGHIQKPITGQWQFQANSSLIKSIQITLITPIRFRHSFNILNTDSPHPGLYPINTEPIKGSHLYSVIRIHQYTSEEIIFDRLEFLDSSNHVLQQYKLVKYNELLYTSKIQIPFVEFFIKIKGKTNQNEYIERLYPHKITPRTVELNIMIDNNSSSYLKPGQQAKFNFTLINHNLNDLTIDVTVAQSSPIFNLALNKNQFTLKSNERQTSYLELTASDNSTFIDSTSEISIIAKSSQQSDAFNTYPFRATIISPLNSLEPLVCTSIFPSGKTPNEMCQGPLDSCASRYWNIYLDITDINPSNIRVGIHSVVLTYYDNDEIFQSKKEIIKFVPNETNPFNLQLFLSPNNCCKKYADIVVYDKNGNQVNCMNSQLFK
jgi:hypothetical protein